MSEWMKWVLRILLGCSLGFILGILMALAILEPINA